MSQSRHHQVMSVLILIIVTISTVQSEKIHRNQSPNGIDRRKAAMDAVILSAAQSVPQPLPPSTTSTITTTIAQQQQCGSCKTHEELKQRNIDAIKSEVLRRLGFDAAPNITGRALPRVTSDQLARMDLGGYFGGMDGMQSDQPFETGAKVFEEEDEYHIKTEMIVAYARQSSHKHRHNHSNQLHFVFSDNTLKYHVKNATLFVYVRGTGSSRVGAQQSFHLDIVQTNPNKGGKGGEVVMASRKVTQPRGQGEWTRVDVTNMVGGWFKAAAIWGGSSNRGSREDKWGFAIRPQSIAGKQVVAVDAEGEDAKVPFVEIQTQETKSRKRRNVGLNCNETSAEPLCCRYPLTVDFEAFGWDFIIAPKQYEANYCAGDCPLFTLQKYAHTHLLKMAAPASAAPCCAPRLMSSITMLYFDPNLNVVYGKLPGMVVDRCGCS